VKHHASSKFWSLYHALPQSIQAQADACFELLKLNPRHPSLQLKKVGAFWSVRVSISYRAVAIQREDQFVWIWIGPHDAYDRLLGGK
jgi:hypothetical protein